MNVKVGNILDYFFSVFIFAEQQLYQTKISQFFFFLILGSSHGGGGGYEYYRRKRSVDDDLSIIQLIAQMEERLQEMKTIRRNNDKTTETRTGAAADRCKQVQICEAMRRYEARNSLSMEERTALEAISDILEKAR